MIQPTGIDFARLVHGRDERVPVEAPAFGTRAIRRLLNLEKSQ